MVFCYILYVFLPAHKVPITCEYYLLFGFPGGSMVKKPSANVKDVGSILGSGTSPGDGNGNPLKYSRKGGKSYGHRSLVDYCLWGPQRVRYDLLTKQ